MIFFLKKEPVLIEFFTADAFAYEYARPEYGTKMIPDWWKNLPPGDLNMRYCKGFTSLYRSSILLLNWMTFNFELQSKESGAARWRSSEEYVNTVPKKPPVLSDRADLYKGMYSSQHPHQHFKLISPWFARTKKLINFAWMDPIYNRDNFSDFSVMPGVVDFKYQSATNVNLLFRYDHAPRETTLLPGLPLVMLVPLTEKRIQLKCHLVSEQELSKYDIDNRFSDPSINGIKKKYNRKKELINSNDSRNKSCPFSKFYR